ncbi:MAG: ABC transporter permease [Candidatus Dormibacteraeota bacterium]|nr:ABC transporter permease [Candidatus Dormibacteraeota bacterium]
MSVSIQPAPSTAETIARLARPRSGEAPMRTSVRLIARLAYTSFKLRYSSSALGYVWSLVRPLALFGMLYLFFVLVLLRGLTSSRVNFPVQLLVGIVIWTFFVEATSTATVSVAANADMLHRARFPRWVLVVAAVASAAITLAVNLTLVAVLGLVFHWFTIGVQTLWVPVLLLELVALALGLGLLLAAFFVYYRDLGYIWEIALQFLFYASAILFPFSLVPAHWQWLVTLNPVAQVTEDLRRALVTDQIPWSATLLGAKFALPLVAVALSVVAGWLMFRRLSARFGERL